MTDRRRNGLILSAVFLLALLSLLFLSLPVYRFDATVYTKRSGNTFIGDERYLSARAEVDAQVADYTSRGIDTEVTEEIIERVNSKGETTSLIIFRVNREIGCSGWDFICTGFPSGKLLVLFLGAELLALILACSAGLTGSFRKDQETFRRKLRQTAALLLILCILFAVLFVLFTNVVINRWIGLYASGVSPTP